MNMITDNLWEEIKDLIPVKKSKFGRPEMCPRKALNAILYVLKTGIQWHYLPNEMGKASTVHGKFRKWIKLEIFDLIMQKACLFYEAINGEVSIWYATDASSSKASFAHTWSGRNPTDRGKQGIKKSIIIDRKGAPLSITIGSANQHDSTLFPKTLRAFHQFNPSQIKLMAADSAYDDKKTRNICKKANFILLAATNNRNNHEVKNYKPRHRWIVERTFGWLNWNRSIKFCWTKLEDSYLAFCHLACSIQLFRMSGVFV